MASTAFSPQAGYIGVAPAGGNFLARAFQLAGRALHAIPPKPLIGGTVAALVLSVSAFGANSIFFPLDGRPSGLTSPPSPQSFRASALSAAGVLDSDLDGLPDAVENFVYGTDPLNWSSTGNGVPDGWLVTFGLDPLNPVVADEPAAKPPADALPSAYANRWPPEFTPTVRESYQWGRPPDWVESQQGPYYGGLDPTIWDSTGDGIPDGWLLHYGLDPRDRDMARKTVGGANGLKVEEAYLHNTNPNEVDTDGDGILDRVEIEGPPNPRYPAYGPIRFPPTNPRAPSTTETGVCDGYLVRNGLDPNVATNSLDDLARSGATTIEKYNWSLTKFGPAICSSGGGLDPTLRSTIGGPIPDGWMLHYGLDPLDPSVPSKQTQTTEEEAALVADPPGAGPRPHVSLTVQEEYEQNRPPQWNEELHGPWWGGTDPVKPDSDGDGISDAAEVRGYPLKRATDIGPAATTKDALAVTNPSSADSDGDGLVDHAEATTHRTDAFRRDTDMDGILDPAEISSSFHLDPLRADTAGDFLRDGVRLNLLEARSARYATDEAYEFPGKPGVARKVGDWASSLPGAKALTLPLSSGDIATLLGPVGDADGDGIVNIVDADMDGDGLLNGWELDPGLYRHSPFAGGRLPRSGSDPLNPDTDGDGLSDGWEVSYGRPLFQLAPPRYDLEPLRWDSDGDGIGDDQEDPDDDSIEWTEFSADTGAFRPVTQLFAYPNVLEQQFKTDPHRKDTDGDGLGDGWKVFWGIVYDAIPAAGPKPTVGLPQAHVVVSSHNYDRFVTSLGAALPGEQLLQTHADIPVLQGGTRTVYQLRGTLNFGFPNIHELGTNPYLKDTSFDGVPDWWAYLHRPGEHGRATESECTHGGLDPLVHYGSQDVDADGLGVAEEFRRNAHPLCADTDLDGLRDGEEVHLGLDPANPADGRRVLDQDADSDGDGILDVQEIVGVRHAHLGAALVRSSPDLSDSDGDGLLDGRTLPRSGSGSNAGFAQDDPWARLFIDLGVSYFTVQQSGSKRFHFWGEVDQSTDPRNVDDSRTGVPAGWLASRNINPSQGASGFSEAYVVGRPAWWNEAVHGPWWGGLDPDATPEGNDLDADGLEDFDGTTGFEDPMPAANRMNAWRPIPWDQYPAALRLQPLPPTAHPSDESLPPVERRLLAQSYLNPRAVGPAFVHADPPANPIEQTQACLEVVSVRNQDGSPTTAILKGTPIEVHGRVLGCVQGQGFPGVTVEGRFGSPSQSFGAAFTDAEGRFRLAVNLSAEHSSVLPTDVAVVLRGAASGVVTWSSDPGIVRPGPNFLTIRSYASPNALPYLQFRPPFASDVEVVPVTVRADSVLSLRTASRLIAGSLFELELQLRDSAGTPLQDSVRITWAGQTQTVRPDSQGIGRITLKAPTSLTGRQTLLGESQPAQGNVAYVTPARAKAEVWIQRPVDLELADVPATIDAGSSADVRGRVFSQGRGLPGVPLLVNLTDGNLLVSTTTTVTDATGSFLADVAVPGIQAWGQLVLVATALETATSVQAETSSLVSIRSLPRLEGLSVGNLTQGEPAMITGRLLEPNAQPIRGATIQVTLGGEAALVQTDDAGAFQATMKGTLPSHPVLQTIRFAGDPDHTSVSNQADRVVLTTTRLSAPPGVSARGEDVAVYFQLTDVNGRGVAAAPLRVRWGTEPHRWVLTNDGGQGTFFRPGNALEPLGRVLVRAAYNGSADGGYSPASAVAVWTIEEQAEIILPSGIYEAGGALPPGRIRDAGTRQPLSRVPITLRLDPGGSSVVTSDGNGEFTIMPTLNTTLSPSRLTLSASTTGNDSYKAAHAHTEIIIRALTRINASVAPVIVAGREFVAQVKVQGMDGTAVPEGRVHAHLDGVDLGSAPVKAGQSRIGLRLAPTEAAGPRVLTIRYDGHTDYAPSSSEHVVQVLREVELTVNSKPAKPGERTIIQVHARTADAPASFVPIFVYVDGLGGGLLGETDEAGNAEFAVDQPANETPYSVRSAGNSQLAPAVAVSTLAVAAPPPLAQKVTRSIAWYALAAAVLLATAVLAKYVLRRNPLEPVVRRVRRILARRGPDAAVIFQAYMELEESAIGLGLLAGLAPTARTLEQAIQPRLPAPSHASLAALMGLFEVARYGADEIGPAHREQARMHLDNIVAALWRDSTFTWNRTTTAEPEAQP